MNIKLAISLYKQRFEIFLSEQEGFFTIYNSKDVDNLLLFQITD